MNGLNDSIKCSKTSDIDKISFISCGLSPVMSAMKRQVRCNESNRVIKSFRCLGIAKKSQNQQPWLKLS